MRSVYRQRFINSINTIAFMNAGVIDSVSKNGHHVQKRVAKKKADDETDIVAGVTVVGSPCRVMWKPDKRS